MAFSDDFNRGDEDLDASPDWTNVSGNGGGLAVSNNGLARVATGTQDAFQCPDQGVQNSVIQATVLAQPFGALFACHRLSDAINYIGGAYLSGKWIIRKVDNNAFTDLGTYTAVLVPGDVGALEMEGDVFILKVNGVPRVVALSDFNSAETRQGLLGRANVSTDPWIDDWSVDKLPSLIPPADEPLGIFNQVGLAMRATYQNTAALGVSRFLEYRERKDPSQGTWLRVGPAATNDIGETLTTPDLTAGAEFELRLVDEN